MWTKDLKGCCTPRPILFEFIACSSKQKQTRRLNDANCEPLGRTIEDNSTGKVCDVWRSEDRCGIEPLSCAL